MNKAKASILICLILSLFLFTTIASANSSITPYASDTIVNYSVTFNSNKSISFYCLTNKVCSTIKASYTVSKLVDGSWDELFSGTITARDTALLQSNKTSDKISSGTYRVSVSYTAGGDTRSTSDQTTY